MLRQFPPKPNDPAASKIVGGDFKLKLAKGAPKQVANAAPPSIQVSLVPPEQLGTAVVVQAQPGFVGRAVLFPPGSIDGVPPGQYTFVCYATEAAPATITIPNVLNVLYADLPDGMDASLLAAINAAIEAQFSPEPPTGTGNDHPPAT